MFRTVEVSDPRLAPPGLRFVTVKSAALGQRADLLLFVPPQAEGLADVPLVVLLHGVYGSHWSWAFQGGAHLTAQGLIDEGAIPPLVLAMPSDGLWGDGSGYVAHGGQDFERWIVDEVPAAARVACAACSEASPQCIAGLSMGGYGALRLAGKHPARYVAAAGLSSMTEFSQFDALVAEARGGWGSAAADRSVWQALSGADAPLPALRLDCGQDDPFIDANRLLHGQLQGAGIDHAYGEHPGGHDWTFWAEHLAHTLCFFSDSLRRRQAPKELR